MRTVHPRCHSRRRILGRRFPVVLLVMVVAGTARPAAAQYREPVEPRRFFLDVNVGGVEEALGGEVHFDSRYLWFGEIGSGQARYPKPSRGRATPMLDLAGGVMLTPSFGVGLGYTRASYDGTVGLLVQVPHPAYLNAPGEASGATGTLARTETAWALVLAQTVVQTPRFEARLFGGPAYVTYSADMVRDVLYDQVADPQSFSQVVTITGYGRERVSAGHLGVSAGADVTYLVRRGIGLGAGVHASLATVELDPEPLSNRLQRVRVGSVTGVVGLRLRLGR